MDLKINFVHAWSCLIVKILKKSEATYVASDSKSTQFCREALLIESIYSKITVVCPKVFDSQKRAKIRCTIHHHRFQAHKNFWCAIVMKAIYLEIYLSALVGV